MALLPDRDSTLTRIYQGYEERSRIQPRRVHLGASEIGRECERQIWYNFRWAKLPEFPGRILRLFETGQLEENRLVSNLQSVGVEVQPFNLKTGRQWGVKAFGGHFSGSLDGICIGLIEAPKTWHLTEFKTHNDKSFAKLVKEGVAKAKPEHFAQMQVYMHLSHEQTDFPPLDRAFYMAVNKNTDEIFTERIHYDGAVALQLKEKAMRIIFSNTPPMRISKRPDYFGCKFCDYHAMCHQTPDTARDDAVLPLKNCRTCIHATARDDGSWTCDHWGRKLAPNEQAAGCEKHLFIPQLLPWEQVDATDSSIVYINARKDKVLTNNEGGTVSERDGTHE